MLSVCMHMCAVCAVRPCVCGWMREGERHQERLTLYVCVSASVCTCVPQARQEVLLLDTGLGRMSPLENLQGIHWSRVTSPLGTILTYGHHLTSLHLATYSVLGFALSCKLTHSIIPDKRPCCRACLHKTNNSGRKGVSPWLDSCSCLFPFQRTNLPAVSFLTLRVWRAGQGSADPLWRPEGVQPCHGQGHRQQQGVCHACARTPSCGSCGFFPQWVTLCLYFCRMLHPFVKTSGFF
jgi:hypothetical protein